MKKDLKSIANFLFEVGVLAKTPRSFTYMLGSDPQSVAEHTNRTVFIGFVLAKMDGGVDIDKVMRMCLFHDLVEARTSDLNYVHQQYSISDEVKALKDLISSFPFGDYIKETLFEYKERKTPESIIAKDADNIEFLLSLKEQIDLGSNRAKTWVPSTLKRFKTEGAKKLAEQILQTESDDWWFSNKEDDWWVNRNKKTLKKRI